MPLFLWIKGYIMPSATEWEVDLGYIRLRGLKVKRDKAKHTVIALHGYLDNANSMIGLNQSFPNDDFIALDFAGHGKSEHRPEGCHYNQLDYVQDLHQLINALSLDKVILVGHSLGGIIASTYAALYPSVVIVLINIDSFGPLTKPANTSAKQLRDALHSRSKKMNVKKSKKADLALASAARARKTDLQESLCRFILERNIRLNTSGEQFWASDPRLVTQSLLRLTEEQAENIMTRIICPTLVIASSTSVKQMDRVFQVRRGWVSQANLVLIDGGHHLHLEKHEETVFNITEFIRQL
ncbi:alpha/beta hydrolase [Alteromonas sp. 5E99-2]|uniref:alpha/beta hydrolase n=1 Tax=Alteromonas sp. 5E99-2 TaxID=2817683 RepID=UPI001A995AC0|nr:alpha/beta hydrolase [Alteromonas sp. 5E99-2]MBO1255150.1 alpha/beta hydrolase [Alteromonas sp. 5E99-2]